MVQYSSQVSIFEGGAKNPLKGISMKFLVLAYNAQLWVGAGSKDVGQPQRHAIFDPTSVETIVCALEEISRVRQWIKPVLW